MANYETPEGRRPFVTVHDKKPMTFWKTVGAVIVAQLILSLIAFAGMALLAGNADAAQCTAAAEYDANVDRWREHGKFCAKGEVGVPLDQHPVHELVTICHKATDGPPDLTLTIPFPAAQAHFAHGDKEGACPNPAPSTSTTTQPGSQTTSTTVPITPTSNPSCDIGTFDHCPGVPHGGPAPGDTEGAPSTTDGSTSVPPTVGSTGTAPTSEPLTELAYTGAAGDALLFAGLVFLVSGLAAVAIGKFISVGSGTPRR